MIRMIVAYDRKRGIAKRGVLPWNIPEDKRYYVEQTKTYGGNVLVGSSTYKTMKSSLVDRTFYVLSSDEMPVPGAELVHDLDAFLQLKTDDDLWVIGGANVYKQVLATGIVDEIYVTKIEADFGCNLFFPDFETAFELIEKSDLKEQNGFIFSFNVYRAVSIK